MNSLLQWIEEKYEEKILNGIGIEQCSLQCEEWKTVGKEVKLLKENQLLSLP